MLNNVFNINMLFIENALNSLDLYSMYSLGSDVLDK